MSYRKLFKGEAKSNRIQYIIEAIEYKPCHRTIAVADYNNCENCDLGNCSTCHFVQYFFLPFPYITFMKCSSRVYKSANLALMFNNKSLETLDDEVYYSKLPNQVKEGFICLGSSESANTVKLEVLVEKFWNTVFVCGATRRTDPVYGSFEEWEKLLLIEVLQKSFNYSTMPCREFFWGWMYNSSTHKEEFCVLK